jgi:uncharacterized repeat protein (TIGR01451 family)
MQVTESTAPRPAAVHHYGQWIQRCLLVIVGLIGGANVTFAGSNTWTPLGPDGGQVYDLGFHPTDPAVMYAATSAGFYRSADAGSSWQLTRVTGSSAHFRPYALAPGVGGPDQVHIASGAQSVMHSEDRGVTVRVANIIFNNPNGYHISAPPDGSAVYYAMERSVYRSTDRGATRQLRGTIAGDPASYIFFFRVAPSDPRVMYAATYDGVYRSGDEGANWTLVFGIVDMSVDLIWSMSVDPQNSNRVWIGTSASVRATDDAGVTWRPVLTGMAGDIDFDPRNAQLVYVTKLGGDVQRTPNGGATWAALTVPPLRGSGPLRLAIHPADSSRLYLFNTSGIFVSTDAGATWLSTHAGIQATSPYRFSPTATSSGRYFFTIAEHGIASFNPVDNSVEPPSSPALLHLLRTDVLSSPSVLSLPSVVIGAFGGAGLAFSTNGGVTWAQPTVAPASNVNYLAAASNGGVTLYAATGNGVYRSGDLGNSWSSSSSGLPAGRAVVLIAASANQTQLYAAVQGETVITDLIYKSVDGGQIWSPTSAPLQKRGIIQLTPHPTDAQTLLVATNEGAFKTTNGGNSWQALELFPGVTHSPVDAVAIDPVNPDIIYVDGPGASGNMVRSVDGGVTFQRLMPDYYEAGGAASIMVDPNQSNRVVAAVPGGGLRELSIEPNLEMIASALASTATPGSAVEFSITATNRGPFDATGVRVEIRLPTGFTAVSVSGNPEACAIANEVITCPAAILRTNGAAVIRVRATPPSEGSFAVTANVSGAQPDATTANNTASASMSITSSPPPSNSGGGGGGGGGGSFNFLAVIALLSVGLLRRYRSA